MLLSKLWHSDPKKIEVVIPHVVHVDGDHLEIVRADTTRYPKTPSTSPSGNVAQPGASAEHHFFVGGCICYNPFFSAPPSSSFAFFIIL